MTKPIISVENLSKAYRLGLKEEVPDTLVGAVTGIAKAPFKNWRKLSRLDTSGGGDGEDILWALKDVSFDVAEGEVVGIIGRNGAGKSTLLKVLSRITEPTSGCVKLRGRVSSLLEVGTGFHPELTGRDNIYMNGTILGMTKREIDRKFDEIVDFSGVEKFLDTPVKRYSSGMQVRLAFAVAAHLEPEILIVDEVLAVGDAEFQKKCIGKMQDVSHSGRTVLFVSHNMDAIISLCPKAIFMNAGRASDSEETRTAVERYIEISSDASERIIVSDYITDIHVQSVGGPPNIVGTGNALTIEVGLKGCECIRSLNCGLSISRPNGERVIVFHTTYHSGQSFSGEATTRLACEIPSLPLLPGQYFIDVALSDGLNVIDRQLRAAPLEVVFEDYFQTGHLPKPGHGYFAVKCHWSIAGMTHSISNRLP